MQRHSRTPTLTLAAAAVLTIFALFSLPSLAWAQCQPEWLPGEALSAINGIAEAATTWDPDGPGPLPPLLIIGGAFTAAGDTLARNIVAWDGVAFHPLGPGLGAVGNSVRALTVFNGDLIAAGSGVGTGGIARWDGASWQPLGTGMTGSSFYIDALAVYQGQLVAGGAFTGAGGNPAANIARWDGASWQPLGAGADASIRAFTIYNGMLIATGDFVNAGGTPAARIAQWDGTSWLPLGAGLGGAAPTGYALTTINNLLIVGGHFTTAGGVTANNVATWDGTTWHALGGGFPLSGATVFSLRVSQGTLVAGGFLTPGSSPPAPSVTFWNGAEWAALGTGPVNTVFAFTSYNNKLIAVGSPTPNVVGTLLGKVWAWDATTWQTFGTIPPTPEFIPYSYTEFNGQIVAAGVSTTNGQVNSLVAARVGNTWSPFTSPIRGAIAAMAVYHGDLYAVGNLILGSVNGLARWDGTAWQPVGGFNGGTLNALAVYNDELVAGGSFVFSQFGPDGFTSFSNIGRWNDSTWAGITGSINGRVLSLNVYNNRLIVGGSFTTAGNTTVNGIAAWDGAAWQALGTGAAGSSGSVSALTTY